MKPLRDRLTYANVVATMALVLAIAGGTAPALVDNSPTTVFDAERGLTEDPVTVLRVPEVGDLRARCFIDDNDIPHTILSWRNKSGSRQLLVADDSFSDPMVFSLQSGEIVSAWDDLGVPYVLTQRVFRAADGGTPMAIVGGAIYNPGDCTKIVVAATALSSE